jgi:hypothetical protein
MKTFIKRLIILFLFGSCAAYSQTYYMNIWSNGSVTSVPVSEISKLTFSDLQTEVGNESAQTIIKNFALLQNYPNPFNPSTTIEYQVPQAGDVEIKIFSINGELVKSFRSEPQGAGQYSVVWDGKNDFGVPVTSGMYIYRVTFGSSMLARKMLLIK